MVKRYSRRTMRRASGRPARFPASTYGRFYVPRGTPEGLARWGPTAALATGDQLLARRTDGWIGQGAYNPAKNFRRWATGAARNLGRGVGSALNTQIVDTINTAGEVGNAQLRMAGGMGLYAGQGTYSENQLIDGGRTAPMSISSNDETDTIIFSDSEFVKDIYAPTITVLGSSSGYNSQTVPCNPGLPGFSPNLSQIAVNYTEYEILQCVYELRPVVSENNVNNGQSGIAMMVFNYNPNDDPYDNKEDVMQAHGSVSGRIVERIVCGVECDPLKSNKTKFFVRTGPVPIGKDNDEYDHGVLTIATNNIPQVFSNTQIFELWVSYTIKLRKRKAGGLRLLNQQRDTFAIFGVFAENAFFGNNTNIVGGGGWLMAQQNNIGCKLTHAPLTAALMITFPADLNGCFEVSVNGEGNLLNMTVGATVLGGTVTDVADMAVGLLYGISPNPYASAHYISNANGWTLRYRVKVRSAVSGTDNTISFPFVGGASGTIKGCSVDVCEFSNAMFTSRLIQKPVLLNMKDSALIAI